MTTHLLSNRLIGKLSITFLLIIFLAGAVYILITVYFTNKYFQETSQKLNAQVANHLINEKFQDASPFLEDGRVNKPLFGDIMHDMMAVNRGIEVYLLDKTGTVLYSVVLDHDAPDATSTQVSLSPIKEFIESNGNAYILGDNPRNTVDKKIFSAAHFTSQGQEGYIYIILAGKEFEEIYQSLFASYFMRLGLGAAVITILFAAGIGLLSIWYLTKNLREIIYVVRRFKEGDLNSRLSITSQTDLLVLATTFNEMADTIVDNIDQLKSVERLRRDLIANVSHDLRTPLSLMQGYIETLQMKKDNLSEQEKAKYLQIIQESIGKLSRLVAQLFEYSQLEADQTKPQKEPFQITELALDLYTNYQMLAKKKDLVLKIDIDKNTPLVFADVGLVERALQNLLDNALKFTPQGGVITLEIKPLKKDVQVVVKDTGPGIPESEQTFIFERYRQASSTKSSSGAGLGLAIVKKILELHDSTVKVISKPNEGATFQFWLPKYQGASI